MVPLVHVHHVIDNTRSSTMVVPWLVPWYHGTRRLVLVRLSNASVRTYYTMVKLTRLKIDFNSMRANYQNVLHQNVVSLHQYCCTTTCKRVVSTTYHSIDTKWYVYVRTYVRAKRVVYGIPWYRWYVGTRVLHVYVPWYHGMVRTS